MNNFTHRTTTNISLSDEDSMEFTDTSMDDNISTDYESATEQPIKKRRINHNDQTKLFESIAKDMKETQAKKMEIFHQLNQPKTELELFFASMCKTVEKFSHLNQAKVKISISKVVSEMEISHIESSNNQPALKPPNLQDSDSFNIEELPVIYV